MLWKWGSLNWFGITEVFFYWSSLIRMFHKCGRSYMDAVGLLSFTSDSSASSLEAFSSPTVSSVSTRSPLWSPPPTKEVLSPGCPPSFPPGRFSTCFQLLVREETILEHFLRRVGELFFFRIRSISSSEGRFSLLIFSARRLMLAPFSWTPLVTVFITCLTLMAAPIDGSVLCLTTVSELFWEDKAASPELMWGLQPSAGWTWVGGFFFGTHFFLGSSLGPPREAGVQPLGSLSCFFSLSAAHCCQLLVRPHTMLMVRSFLMFLFVEDFRCWVKPVGLSVIMASAGVSLVILLSNPLQQLLDLDIFLLSSWFLSSERFLSLLLVAAALKRSEQSPPWRWKVCESSQDTSLIIFPWHQWPQWTRVSSQLVALLPQISKSSGRSETFPLHFFTPLIYCTDLPYLCNRKEKYRK